MSASNPASKASSKAASKKITRAAGPAKAKRVAARGGHVAKNMAPNPYAASFFGYRDSNLTLRWDERDWCTVFHGRKKVWSCNGQFARVHFTQREVAP